MKDKIELYSPQNSVMYTYLNKYLPHYLRLLDPNKRELDLFIEKFEYRYSLVEKALKVNGIFNSEACLIDQIWDAEENNEYSIAFLQFIDQQCKVIYPKITNQLKKKIKNSLINLMVNFDSEKSRYLDNIGEICILAKILENSKSTLIDIEYELQNGKSIDFEFVFENKKYLVEVNNISFDIDKITCEEDFTNFIDYREKKKIREKLESAHLDENITITFTEILWGKLTGLYKYYNVIKGRNLYNGILTPLMCIGQFYDKKLNHPIYLFLTLTQFLEKYSSTIQAESTKTTI